MNQNNRGGQGRGQNRHFNRGNCHYQHRGQGRGNSNNAGVQRKEMKFLPHSTRAQQSNTYDVVKDHILDLIQKTYKNPKDVVKSLRDLEMVDLTSQKPTREQSKKKKEEERVLSSKLMIWSMRLR